MFFSDALLSRRSNGPLARVWLASHMGDRRLSKAQLMSTSIPKSITAIMGPDLVPMALRLSGQLLLGVARIYSRKAKYLMDDCNDALLKIKMTFRPGTTASVDMTADQLQVTKGAITRQEQVTTFDLLYQDLDIDIWNPMTSQPQATPGRGVAIANDADITRLDDEFEIELPRIEFGDDFAGYEGFRYDSQLAMEVQGDLSSGQKRVRDEDDMSVEMGRHAAGSSGRLSNRYSRSGIHFGSEDQTFASEGFGGGDGFGIELDFEPISFRLSHEHGLSTAGDIDLSGILDAQPDVPITWRGGTQTPRAVSSPPIGPAPADDDAAAVTDITPRTAKRVADTAAENSAKKLKAAAAAARTKVTTQIIDDSIELAGSKTGRRGPFGNQAINGMSRGTDPSLLVPARFLPRSRLHLRLLEIEADPAAFYLPRSIGDGKIFAGPAGLPEPLAELFHFAAPQMGPPNKKARRSNGTGVEIEDLSIEFGRRDSLGRLSDRVPAGDLTALDDWDPSALMDNSGGGDGFPQALDFSPVPYRTKSLTPAPEGGRNGSTLKSIDLFSTPLKHRPGEGVLGVFDVTPSTGKSQRIASQEEERQAASSGWSQNTVRALRVLNDELGPAPIEAGEEIEQRTIEFSDLAEKASRPAAAAFFFELLVLGSRGCIDLAQHEAYTGIDISAKPKLWEVIGRSNMAPRTSSIGPDSTPVIVTPIGR